MANLIQQNVSCGAYNVPAPTTSIVHTYSAVNQTLVRSNAGTAMSDMLPAPVQGGIPNGWAVTFINGDASANLTFTVAAPTVGATATISGLSSFILSPGAAITFKSDGINYFAMAAAQGNDPYILVTGSPINLGTFTSGTTVARSNATTAMADTLPVASSLGKGWTIWVMNLDASATDTITPVTSTIKGASTFAIAAGKSSRIISDGTNYQALTAE